MWRRLVAAAFVAAAAGSLPAQAQSIDDPAAASLEGVWLLNAKPDKGSCLAHGYVETQLEFEFRKSGGHLTIFEPFDLFRPMQIAALRRDGDSIAVDVRALKGEVLTLFRLRFLAPDRIETRSTEHPETAPEVFWRCAKPVHSVNDRIPWTMLSRLSPATSGSDTFTEVQPGIAEADLCSGRVKLDDKQRDSLRYISFDLIGPDYFYVFGSTAGGHRLDLDAVRRIRRIDDRTLRLDMETREVPANYWDRSKRLGARYTLTVIDDGAGRIEIPELGTRYFRCGP